MAVDPVDPVETAIGAGAEVEMTAEAVPWTTGARSKPSSRPSGGEVTQVGSVAYCDGDWAVSGNSPAYLNQPFMHREHGWVVFAADSSNPGVGHECCTADYLDQLGMPDAAREQLTTCMDTDPEPSGTMTATPEQ